MPRGGGRGKSLSGYVGAGKALVGGALAGQSSAEGGGNPGEQEPAPPPAPAGPTVLFADDFEDGIDATWTVTTTGAGSVETSGAAALAGTTGVRCAAGGGEQAMMQLIGAQAGGDAPIAEPPTRVISVRFAARVGALTDPEGGNTLMQLCDATTPEIVALVYNPAAEPVPGWYLLMWQQEGWPAQVTPNVATLVPGESHTVEVIYDRSGPLAEARWSVDGQPMGTLVDPTEGSPIASVVPGIVRLGAVAVTTAGALTVDVDNVSVADGVQGV